MKRITLPIWTALLVFAGGCYTRELPPPGEAVHAKEKPRIFRLRVTAYCPCGRCCGWRYNWRGVPVVAAGPQAGKPKQVGTTASGTRARPGTIAADTSIFPFGTMLYVPGYGYGRVEDRGRDIRGYHIDLYFHSHREALEWGSQIRDARVWFPPGAAPPPSRPGRPVSAR
jgi:3D (Asp-Asp-Asp) domain-containing protein